jgi:hypothetical protein
MTEVIERIRLVSAEKGADDLLVEAAKAALEKARYRFAIRNAIDPEEVHEARISEFEYARGIGFYWISAEYHVATLQSGEHIHIRGIKGRTMMQAKVELEIVITSKIAECPW